MKCVVIYSNHGNHSGVNRKWQVIAKCDTIEEAHRELAAKRERTVEDDDNISYIDKYTPGDTQWSYDGHRCIILTQEEYDRGFFNGGGNGYGPREVIEFFDTELK